jgi:hypothetical protein
VLVVLVVVLLLVVSVALSRWSRRAGAQSRSCCGGGQWPPDDLA